MEPVKRQEVPAMSELPESRIIITIDSSAFSDATLEYAVNMAARLKRPLHGIFIEDTDLLSTAELPFSMEICLNTGQPRRLSSSSLQSAFDSIAKHFQQQLSQRADKMAVRWSISSVRGRRRDFRFEDYSEADYCIFEPGITTRKPAGAPGKINFLVIDGSGEDFYKTLASLLTPLEGKELHLTLADGANKHEAEQLQNILPSGTQVHQLDKDQLTTILQHSKISFDYVVVSRRRWLDELAPLLGRLNCPLILVG